jgi:MFS family permease
VTSPQPAEPVAPRGGPLRVLRHRDFRILWLGLVGSAIGTWMQIVGQALLVLQLAHGSALALGAVSLAQALAFFVFALFGGAVADHVDKRRLLLVTQTLCMGFAALLGVLTLLHVVQVWMVVVLAFLQGAALSFDQPTRGALIPDLVPKDELLGAFALQSIVFTGSSAIGPALAGVCMPFIGFAGLFFANAVSYLAVLGALLVIHPPAASAPTRTPSPRAIADALSAVRSDAALPWLLLVWGALLFLGPSPPLLLPVMGTRVLHLSPTMLGVLFAATGVGTVIGGLVLASRRSSSRKARLMLASAALWAAAMCAFSASRSFVPALATLLLVGIFQVGVGSTMVTLLQTRAPRAMSGRVMSLNTLLIMGVRPLGDFLASALIAGFGAPVTAAACAAMVGVLAIAVATRRAVREA